MKFCKVCYRQAESEEFEFCPYCGYELVDKVVLQIPLHKHFYSKELLKYNFDFELSDGQVESLLYMFRQKAIEIEFDGDKARSIEIVGI